jgi:hypothetical protein
MILSGATRLKFQMSQGIAPPLQRARQGDGAVEWFVGKSQRNSHSPATDAFNVSIR